MELIQIDHYNLNLQKYYQTTYLFKLILCDMIIIKFCPKPIESKLCLGVAFSLRKKLF